MPEGGTDRELLRRIVEEDGIQTEPGTRLGALLSELWAWLRAQLGGGPGVDLEGAWQLAGLAGLGLLLGAAAWTLWRVARDHQRRRRPPAPGVAVVALSPPPDPASALERALAAGDARAALAALWAELALRLGQAGVAAVSGGDRTHQELVRAVRRDRPAWTGHPDLRQLARSFDRLCYGPTPPRIADVRALIPKARGLPA